MRAAKVAYFSMEIGLCAEIPSYSGGLGILAGDTVKSAADLDLPCVAVTLLSNRGYFSQSIDAEGHQHELDQVWNPAQHLELLDARVTIEIERREVQLQAWKRVVASPLGGHVDVLFLDSDVPENSVEDRRISSHLYGGDQRYRIHQELALGVGGVRMLTALGYTGLGVYHMNEGHAAFLILELLRLNGYVGAADETSVLKRVRDLCVFTTHTPVDAGHDRFPMPLLLECVGGYFPVERLSGCIQNEKFNMTLLALHCSRFVNGVSMTHAAVSRRMFPDFEITAITNGIHTGTWVSPELHELFSRHLPGWKQDPVALRSAVLLPKGSVREAHRVAKRKLLTLLNTEPGARFEEDAFTIGFARRATPYKRHALILEDIEALLELRREIGPFQLIYGGKAHPRDGGGKAQIRRVVELSRALKDQIPIAYVENYDMSVAPLLVSGVDLWLNTPRAPLEASGTSGMKAGLNGVPSLSVLDGWWVEGCVEGITGWGIPARNGSDADALDRAALLEKLKEKIMPLYYSNPDGWEEVQRHAIALTGSYFSTHRMVQEYARRAYFPRS